MIKNRYKISFRLLIVWICLINGMVTHAQQQIGPSFQTTNENEWMGWDVDINQDGSIIAIGSIAFPDYDSPDGRVRIYKRNEDSWEQIGSDLMRPEANNAYGYSISLSADGKRLAVGIPSHDSPYTGAGAVQLFSITETEIIPFPTLIEGQYSYHGIGFNVDLSHDGRTLIVGSQDPEYAQVRIYEEKEGVWQQKGNELETGNYGDKFGFKVRIDSSGNRITILSPSIGVLNGDPPAVQVYDFIENEWVLLDKKISSENLEERVENFAMNTQGNMLAVQNKNELFSQIKLYTLGDEEIVLNESIVGNQDFFISNNEFNLAQNGTMLVLTSFFSIKLFDFQNNEWVERTFVEDTNKSINDIELSEDGNYLILTLWSQSAVDIEVIVYEIEPLVSLDLKSEEEIMIYPNPVTHWLNVNTSFSSYQIHESTSGHLLVNQSVSGRTIDVSNLVPGSYILTIQDGKNIHKVRFLKM
ncbi:MAG: T9SS type A sorting domain-containing protein [Saprospiraceae bacterium]|nr:T9SS type A sorting domain-containing protein [Saprospiraceae bacterium]